MASEVKIVDCLTLPAVRLVPSNVLMLPTRTARDAQVLRWQFCPAGRILHLDRSKIPLRDSVPDPGYATRIFDMVFDAAGSFGDTDLFQVKAETPCKVSQWGTAVLPSGNLAGAWLDAAKDGSAQAFMPRSQV